MRIGVIGAMQIEVDNLKASMSDISTKEYSGVTYVCGTIGDKEVVAAVCGIGKVFAAICAEAMILEFHVDYVINIGVGGTLCKELGVMDVAGKLIAEWAVSLMGGAPTPIIMTSVLFIISCTLTQFMSNTAAAALLAPVGVAISQQLGASPKAVLMAIGVAASCAFATPVGTPPCTLVLGPGGYKFMDYVKVGVPLVILCFIVSIIVIPMVWPFFPG